MINTGRTFTTLLGQPMNYPNQRNVRPNDGGAAMRLKGKVALITGSTRGMGKEFALGFAREGADVIVNGRSVEKAAAVAKEIEGHGVRSLGVRADVSSLQDVTRMVEEATEHFGRIDVLVNNAGVNPFILEAEKIKE